MHIVALTLLLVVLFLLWKTGEQFVASYDMMINKSLNPTYVLYHGREKDDAGKDFYDYFLQDQLSNEYSNKYKTEGEMQFQTLRFLSE